MPDWDFGTAIRAAHDELLRDHTAVGEERAARLLLSFVRESSTPVEIEGLAVSALLQLSNQGWWERTVPSMEVTSGAAMIPPTVDRAMTKTTLTTVDQSAPESARATPDRAQWPTVSEIFDQVLRRQAHRQRKAKCGRKTRSTGRPRRR